MTNKYLTKLHSLEQGAGTGFFETRDLKAPSKASEPSSESFEGDQGWRISENGQNLAMVNPCANSVVENDKRGTPTNPQNLQNPGSPSVPDGVGCRVTIVEIPATGLRYRRTFAALQLKPPTLVETGRWRECIQDGSKFLAQWGEQAEGLGWTSADLFGLHQPPAKPHTSYNRLSRYDCTGLCWWLHGNPVVAITASTASIRHPTGNVTVFRKNNRPALGRLGDSLDDLK
jgi:hypothetical protein